MLKCRDVGGLLSDYLNGELDPQEKKEVDEHLRDCPPCEAFLKTLRRTVELAKEFKQEEIPEELRSRLQKFLKSKIKGQP